MERIKKQGILNSDVIAELRESKLTVSEFAKRFGMKRGVKYGKKKKL